MTGLSEDILRDWQVRKSKTQKTRFIAFLQEKIPGLRVEEGGFPAAGISFWAMWRPPM